MTFSFVFTGLNASRVEHYDEVCLNLHKFMFSNADIVPFYLTDQCMCMELKHSDNMREVK